MCNRNTLITSHLMPNEFISFERMITQLKKASEYLEDTNSIEQHYVINLSPTLFDWNSSSITQDEVKKLFLSKADEICNWSKYTIEFITDDSILGTTAQKRKIARECPKYIDQLLFLDSDIYFHEYTLKYLIDGSKAVKNKYYIITPQTVKLWDYTWDVITNNSFVDKPYQYYKTCDPNCVLEQEIESINLIPINTFKFGCGWFTLYSKSLLQFIDIPNELGPYGSEDTYIMFASMHLKEKGYDIQQYILDGIFICEDYIYKQIPEWNVIRKNTKESYYVKHDTPQFQKVMNDFIKKIDLLER